MFLCGSLDPLPTPASFFDLLPLPAPKGAVLQGWSYPAPPGLSAVCARWEAGGREEKDVEVFSVCHTQVGSG